MGKASYLVASFEWGLFKAPEEEFIQIIVRKSSLDSGAHCMNANTRENATSSFKLRARLFKFLWIFVFFPPLHLNNLSVLLFRAGALRPRERMRE